MDRHLETLLTPLPAGELLRIADGVGRGIAVFAGRVWITQHGDRRDIVLDAGESFVLDRPGLAIVQAFSDARVLLFGPTDRVQGTASARPAGAAWRPLPSAHALHQRARALRSVMVGRFLRRAAAALRPPSHAPAVRHATGH